MSNLHEQTIIIAGRDDRLIISPLVESDRDDYVSRRWHNRVPLMAAGFPGGSESRNFLHKLFDDELTGITNGECHDAIRRNDQLIGQVGLFEQGLGEGITEPTLDIWVDRGYYRRRIAKSVVCALVSAAFDADATMRHVRMVIGARNVPSKQLFAKVGAVQEEMDETGENEVWRLYRGKLHS